MSSFLDDKGLNKFFQAIKAKFDARYLNGPANSLIEQNKKSFLKVWHGTADEFKQVETKESNTAYLVEGESADTEYAPITHAARHSKDGADPIDPVSIGAVPYAGSYDCANDTEIDAALDDMAIKAGGCSTIYGNITVTAIASLLVGAWSIRIHFINLKAIDVIATKTGVSGKPITIRTRTKRAGTWENWKTLSDDSSIAAALEGKAPAGFGLGEYATQLPERDCNKATFNGWYINQGADEVNCPKNGDAIMSYGTLFVSAKSYTNVTQFYFPAISNFTGYCIRTFDGTTWTPWEWPDPPMLTGVEYRTTERYWEKPVYAQVINCGSMPDIGSSKNVSIAAFNVAVVTFISGWCTYYSSMFDANLLLMTMSANSTNIVINNINRTVDANAVMYAQIKYTKKTD